MEAIEAKQMAMIRAWQSWAEYLFARGYHEEAFDLWDEAATMSVGWTL